MTGHYFRGSHINSFEASYLLDINELKKGVCIKGIRDFPLKTRRGNSFIAEMYFTCTNINLCEKPVGGITLDNGQLDMCVVFLFLLAGK